MSGCELEIFLTELPLYRGDAIVGWVREAKVNCHELSHDEFELLSVHVVDDTSPLHEPRWVDLTQDGYRRDCYAEMVEASIIRVYGPYIRARLEEEARSRASSWLDPNDEHRMSAAQLGIGSGHL